MANLDSAQILKIRKLLPIFLSVQEMYEFDEDVDEAMTPNFTKNWFAILLMAIASRESHFGLLLDTKGTGDNGHGRGIMQIDDRSHKQWISTHNWKDAATNIEYAADVWMENFNYFCDHYDLVGDNVKLIWAATAAYNCGAGNVKKALQAGSDVDTRTTGHDYSSDVRARMKAIVSLGLI
jgi:membrane-bound lytic murein transglycosylase MltF